MGDTLQRVELHCHTKAGGNAAMYAGEIINFASLMEMPAVAITDTSCILAFPEMEMVWDTGNYTARPIFGMEMLVCDEEGTEFAVSVLLKNDTGKENLYRMISDCQSESLHPVFSMEKLFANREGMLLGSGAENGRLYQMAADLLQKDMPMTESELVEDQKLVSNQQLIIDQKLTQLISQYDYIELLPYEKYADLNKRIIGLCDAVGVPAVAISDAHYIFPADKLTWDIMQHAKNATEDARMEQVDDAIDLNSRNHIFVTKAMLEAFSYLPEEKAQEIVVNNTIEIAKQCEVITVCPKEKHYPVVANAREKLWDLCVLAIDEKYDASDRGRARERLEFEFQAINKTDMAFVLLQVRELLQRAQLRSCEIGFRGCAPASILSYLLGITEIDPLKYCLAPEFVFGLTGNREIDIDINFPPSRHDEVVKLLQQIEGVGKTLQVGCVSHLTEKTALEWIEQYERDTKISLDQERRMKICYQIVGNTSDRGRHPGGVILFPEGYEYEANTPSVHMQGNRVTTYFEFFNIDRAFFKLDLLQHDSPEKLRKLAERTGVELRSVPVCADEVLALFTPNEEGELDGCKDLPEFRHVFVQNLVKVLRPKTFDELVKILGLAHGTGVWTNNGEKLVRENAVGIRELISTRDDIFDYLMSFGFDRVTAYSIAEAVRKGIVSRGRNVKWQSWKKLMLDAGIPEWYTWSCEQIRYLFPRAHATSYLLFTMRLGWFKVHYPKEFEEVMKEYEPVEYK